MEDRRARWAGVDYSQGLTEHSCAEHLLYFRSAKITDIAKEDKDVSLV